MIKGLLLIFAFLVIIFTSFILNTGIILSHSQSYTNNHFQDPKFKFTMEGAPISINGNSDFQNQAKNNGWKGNGSENNPIIMNNFKIITYSYLGISIQNTNFYFVLQNSEIEVYRNNVPFALRASIYLNNVTNGAIQNILVNHSNGIGFLINYSSNIVITNNIVMNNEYGGFIFYESSNNYILNNTGINNGDSSFMFEHESNNNTFLYNLAQKSSVGYGFYIVDSNYNLLCHNQVDNFVYLGLSIYANLSVPMFNNISYNNFINNDQEKISYHNQAGVDGNTNILDHNYWSDLTGLDQNNDGIVDVPYITSGTGVSDKNAKTTPFLIAFTFIHSTPSTSFSSSISNLIVNNVITNNVFNYSNILIVIFVIVGFTAIFILRMVIFQKKYPKNEFSSSYSPRDSFKYKYENSNKDLTEKQQRFCPICGELALEEDVFCFKCGSSL